MNEITLSLYIILVIVQLLTMAWVLIRLMEPAPIDILVGLISVVFGYVNSQMILNGNVNVIVADTSTTTYIPIQSLPFHYLLLALATFMTIVTIYITVMIVKDIFSQKNNSFMKNWMRSSMKSMTLPRNTLKF